MPFGDPALVRVLLVPVPGYAFGGAVQSLRDAGFRLEGEGYHQLDHRVAVVVEQAVTDLEAAVGVTDHILTYQGAGAADQYGFDDGAQRPVFDDVERARHGRGTRPPLVRRRRRQSGHLVPPGQTKAVLWSAIPRWRHGRDAMRVRLFRSAARPAVIHVGPAGWLEGALLHQRTAPTGKGHVIDQAGALIFREYVFVLKVRLRALTFGNRGAFPLSLM